MSNSMQSHFNKEDEDDNELKEAYSGTISITTDPGALDGVTISQDVTDGNVVMRWDGAHGDYGQVHWDNETEALRKEFKQYKEEMNARIAEMEDQVAIVRRDVALEEEFEELKDAWKSYNEVLEKLRTFKAIKDSA